jgi:hypothetical protein
MRTATTDAQGGFAFADLQSGNYTLQIVAPGFAPYRNTAVSAAIGRTVNIQARLAIARGNEQITVSAEENTLDTTQPSPVTNIDRDRIEELPIPSRNYLNFTLLSPSLVAANPAFAQLTAPAESNGFAAGGLRPSSNAVFIDGVEDDDEYTGMSRTELSPEAISDFQVVNHGYEARSGGAAGGSVDVETRSGANLQHGDAFLFVQNGALNGTPALERVPRKPDENRLRWGFSTGGAMRRDKLFYYIAGEQEMSRGEESGDSSPQSAQAIDAALAGPGPLRGFRVQQGFFPTVDEETELSGRVDRTRSRSQLMLRYALVNNRAVNDAFNKEDLQDLSARGSSFINDNSLNGSWTLTISPHLINDIEAEFAQRRVALRTGSQSGPGIVVAGLAELGTPFTGNQHRYETHADAGESLLWQHGNHLFRAGVAVNHIALRAADRDGFGGLYVFPDLAALQNALPDFYTQTFGNPDVNFAEGRTAAYLQDHWTASRTLTVDLGLRYDFNHLPSSLPQHAFNFAPRAGFAWSPNRQLVVRGGAGIFYDRYLLSTIARIADVSGTCAKQQVAEGSDAAALYHSAVAFTEPQPNIAPGIWQAQNHLGNPYAETASFGVERALPAQWTAKAEYRFVQGVKMGRTINSNLPPPVVLTAANASSLGIAAPTPQQIGRPVFPPQRLNPAYDAVEQFQTEAHSSYNGVTVTANRQFTEDFELMAGYTFSKTLDDASYDTENPQNPYNLRAERARSLNDLRHRFVLSGLWVIGPDMDEPRAAAKDGSSSFFMKAITGLEFAPIFSAQSGFPVNPLTGVDSNREHVYPFAARPLGTARNSLTTPPAVNFDLRALRMVPIWRGHLDIVAESFNLLNKQNVQILNSVFGSGVAPEPPFAAPIQESDPRRVQFSLDFEY